MTVNRAADVAREIVNQYDGDWQVIKERGELASLIASAIQSEVDAAVKRVSAEWKKEAVAMVDAAVRAERERCAKIARDYHPQDGNCCHCDPDGHRGQVAACDGIYEAIRLSKQEKQA